MYFKCYVLCTVSSRIMCGNPALAAILIKSVSVSEPERSDIQKPLTNRGAGFL